VLEGLGASNLEDHGGPPTSLRQWITYPINWLTYRMGDFMSGVHSPESTCTVLGRLHCPVLLIASGRGNDSAFSRRFYEAANEPKSSWELPQAQHGGGLFFDREVYQKHVLEFFDVHLRGKETST
jgi:hypothetical protein